MIQTELNGRYVDAAGMFGCGNTLSVPPLPESEGATMTGAVGGDAVLQLLCLGLLFSLVLLAGYRGELRRVASGLWSGYAEEAESNRKTAISNGFFTAAALTGVLAATIAIVRTSLLWLPDGLLPDRLWVAPVSAGAVIAGLLAVALYQWSVLQVVGLVTDRRDFISTLLYVKKACFSATAMLTAPVILLSALSSGIGETWFYILAGECFILSFLFLKETFVLFIRKKVPIFQWFLYLCTVEAFPLTLICASIARFR